MGDVEQLDEQKLEQVKEQERAAAAKKRREQDKRRLKNERQAAEREKNKEMEAVAAAAAAEAAAVAAEEQARVDAKAAAAAEVEAQRLAKIAAKKNKNKPQENLDDLAVLELAITANANVDGETVTACLVDANKSSQEVERAAQLRDALKARQKLTEKGRKANKKKEKEQPSAEEIEKAAALAASAEIQRNRNIQKERDAYHARLEAKSDKTKPSAVVTSPVDMRTLEAAPSPNVWEIMNDVELELESLEAKVENTSRFADRVTKLMIKLDELPVASTELRACRKRALARLDALAT